MSQHAPKLIGGLIVAALIAGAAAAQPPAAAPAAAPAAPAGPPAPTVGPGVSNDEARAPRPARARGVPTALAIEAAVAANAACAANGGLKTTTLVADSAGVPIVVISNDGAAAITQRIAMGKALVTLKYKAASSAVSTRAAAEPAIAAELAADTRIFASRPGSVPIMAGAEVIGAIAVSGAPSGATDETCANAGLDKIKARVN